MSNLIHTRHSLRQNFRWAFIGLAAASAWACSSTSKKSAPPAYSYPLPPADFVKADPGQDAPARDKSLRQNLKRDTSESMRVLVYYKQATLWSKTDPARACTIWMELSQNEKFPLAKLARLRAVETCPITQEKDSLAIDKVMQMTTESWLSEQFARAALNRASKAGDKKWEMQLSLDVAKFETVQTLQITLLERSVALARELRDAAFEAQATQYLYKIAPRKNPAPPVAQYLAVANDFKRARAFELARDYYDKVMTSKEYSDIDKLRALDGVRMSYKLEKKTDKFIKSTNNYANFARWKFFETNPKPASLNRYLEAQITLARAVWTDNDPRKAEGILNDAEKEIRGRVWVDESIFLRARIVEERGEYDNAVKILDSVDAKHMERDKAFKLKVLWYRAWNLRKLGRQKDAIAALDALVKTETNSALLVRNMYWLGRSQKDAGDQNAANQQFEALIDADPIGYYGILAYRELNQKIPPLPDPDVVKQAAPLDDNFGKSDPLTVEERLKMEWLIAVGEEDVGNRLLNAIGIGRRNAFTQDQSFELLRLYARTGSYNALFARLNDLTPMDRKALVHAEPELIFPLRWKNLIVDAGKKYDVKPEFIDSIIRQESAFNPEARSFADAFGLMQLIPEMAKRAEATTGIHLETNEDLYKPELNIPLGTSFLRTTLDRWNNAFIPTVASYNASEKAVIGWLKTRDRKDPVAFIEDVPYEETRTYLKLVMRNFVFYSRLNSGQKPIAFPEWCLGDLQAVKP